MIRHVLAILVLMRLSSSLALILLEGASSFLQAAAFMIALAGLAPVGLVIGGMLSNVRGLPPRASLGRETAAAVTASCGRRRMTRP